MKLAVVGSRSITDSKMIRDILEAATNQLSDRGNGHITIISGGAPGVDEEARLFAKEKMYDYICFKPYHLLDSQAEFKPKYFFTRNRQIVDNADYVLALWDGESNGTKYTMGYAEKKGKKLEVFKIHQ